MVSKGGIVRDQLVRLRAVDEVLDTARALGLEAPGIIESPIQGASGNHEFLAHLRQRATNAA